MLRDSYRNAAQVVFKTRLFPWFRENKKAPSRGLRNMVAGSVPGTNRENGEEAVVVPGTA